jgi:hypothetical protein
METLPFELVHCILKEVDHPKDFLNLLLTAKFVGKNLDPHTKREIIVSFASYQYEEAKTDKKCGPYGTPWDECNPQEEYFGLANGWKEGSYKKYNGYDGLTKEGNYLDNKREGLWKWWSFGLPHKGGYYKKGKKVGVWKEWGVRFYYFRRLENFGVDWVSWWDESYWNNTNGCEADVVLVNYGK